MHSRRSSGSKSIAIPSASSTSALPLCEVTRRLPCFTTVAPPAANTNVTAVETLNRSMPSPPVPQTSMTGPPSISNGTARSNSTRTKLAISLAVSPFSCSAVRKSAFVFASIESESKKAAASWTSNAERSLPSRTFSINAIMPPPHSRRLRRHLTQPIPINHGRNFRRLDLTAAAPKNIRIRNRNIFRSEMRVDRRLVLEQSRSVSTVRDGHDVDVPKLRTAFAPVTMCEDMMSSHLTTYFNLAAGRHRPMKETVEPRYAHTASTWFHVFEERGKTADDFPSIQRFSNAIKFIERNSGLSCARGPWCRSNFFRRKFA